MKRRAHDLHLKEVDSKTGEFSGYGSVFDVVDYYGEIVTPGAFAGSLAAWAVKGRLPPMLWQHRPSEPLGPFNLMREDARGLYVEGKILVDAGPTERRALAHLKAGTVTGLSIGYEVPEGGLTFDPARDAWLLSSIDLWETSLVTFPANEAAQVDQVKEALASGPRDFERFLREAGLTRGQAKCLMARGFEGLLDLREASASELEQVAKNLNEAIQTLSASR